MAAVLVVGVLLGLTGCTGGGEEPAPSEDPTTSVAPEPSSEPSSTVSRSFELGGQQVDLEVGPVVVGDGYATLPVVARAVEGGADAESVTLDTSWGNPYGYTVVGPNAVRLVDPVARTVSTVAQDGDGRSVVTSQLVFLSAEPEVLCMVFAAPTSETADVLLPYAGYVAEVPVVSIDEAPELVSDGECALSKLTDSVPADLVLPVIPLDTYVEELGGDVRTRTEDDAVRVAVSADVLFATDSAELGGQADVALSAVGAQLAGYTGGDLVVVGHTDDVASDAYNMDLSVRRAQAVADRLGQLVDLGPFAVTVEGRGESQPVVAGTDEAARAANRRVELEFTPAAEAASPEATVTEPTGEMPAADGPEATGADGVRITYDRDRTFTVSVDEVRRIGPNLVGEFTVERVDGESVWGVDGLFSSGAQDGRGKFDAQLQVAATNVTLLVGSTRYYPLDYVRNDLGDRDPLSDRYLTSYIEEGQSQTVTVVWPDVPGDTVTVDSPAVIHSSGQQIGGPPFRLTDVPVVTP